MTMTDKEHAAFLRGFALAKPPGSVEADALDRAEGDMPVQPGHMRVAVPKALARKMLDEVFLLPDYLASAAWTGFLRGLVAKAGAAPVHVHDAGRA